MLVIQLTWGLFLSTMMQAYPKHTKEGLLLIWQEYERNEEEMPDEDFRIDPVGVSQAFRELPFHDFAQEYSMCFSFGMSEAEFDKFKQEVETLLDSRFIGFTYFKNTVVFRR